ncbi:hypothetical protein BGX21_010369 [Mortierella sp. AD011]|nr:hypothetical protein BGX21_010369 [Mortierella sp. AD011]
MVLSAIWTLAFGAQNPLPDLSHDDSPLSDNHENGGDQDVDQNERDDQANTERIFKRQRDAAEAERDILGTTVYLPAPNIRDEAAENKSGFILVVTSLTLNNIGCYPFFGIRDRHQVQYSLSSRDVILIRVEFLLYIPLYPLLRNSLLLRMDSRAGPWPTNSSYLNLLKTFVVDYVHDLIGLFYSRGRSPSILPLYSTVLPSYVLNLLFEIIQTWIFRWIYPKLVPASFFSRKKSSKSTSHPPPPPSQLLSPIHLGDTSGDSPSPSMPAGEPSSSVRQGSQQQQQASNGNGPITAVTATEISATIMAAMPTVSSSSPTSTTVAVNRARRGLRYLSAVTPRNPTLLQEFYPEMVCAMTSSMITRVLLYPLDTVASRVSAQGGSFPGIGFAPTPYSGFWDCWVRSIRPEGGGISGLYSGVIDCIIIEAMVRWVVLEGTWFAHLVIKWVHRR